MSKNYKSLSQRGTSLVVSIPTTCPPFIFVVLVTTINDIYSVSQAKNFGVILSFLKAHVKSICINVQSCQLALR